MERKEISKALAATLDTILPDWINYVDEDQAIMAKKSGIFSPSWLLRHLLTRSRKLVHRESRDRAYSIVSGALERSPKATMEEYRKFNLNHDSKMRILANFEREVLKLDLGESDHNRAERFKSLFKSLLCDLSRAREIYDHQISNLRDLTLKRIGEHDISRLEIMDRLLENRINRFRREYCRNASRQRRLLKSKLFSSFCSNELTPHDEDKLASKIAKMMVSEVSVQKKLRVEAVNYAIEKLIIGESGPEAVSGYFGGLSELTDQEKKLMAEIVGSGYFPHTLPTPPGRRRKNELPSDPFSRGLSAAHSGLSRLLEDLRDRERSEGDYVEEIYGGGISGVCSGGWWSTLANVGTAGVCSGCAIGSNLVSLFGERHRGRRNIFLALDTIFFFSLLPFQFTGSLLYSTKFLEIVQTIGRIHGMGAVGGLMNSVVRKVNEFSGENRNLLAWIGEFPKELMSYLGL